MSVELTVYTRLPEVCAIPRLAARLAEDGWEPRVLDEYSRTAEVMHTGTLPREGVVYGWARSSRQARRFAGLFPTGLLVDAQALPEAELAACNVSISLLETADDQFERDQWSGSPLPAEKLAVLQQADCRYELSTWTADTLLSARFLRAVARALAKETGGIVFDPVKVEAKWAEEMAPGMPEANPREDTA